MKKDSDNLFSELNSHLRLRVFCCVFSASLMLCVLLMISIKTGVL